MKKYIITILGCDRPGIIAAVANVLFELEFNIEDVRQTILQSEFSGIFIVAGPDTVANSQLEASILASTKEFGLHCHVKSLETNLVPWIPERCESFVISTRGPDCKGLVAQITAVLAEHNVNVTQLLAAFRGGSEPGDNVMVYEVDVPIIIDQKAFRGRLQEKAREMNLEINIQHKKIFEAINRI